MAARPLEIARLAPGAPGWTDGVTVYLDPTSGRDEQLRTLAVQASLLAAGSLEPGIVGRLGARRGAARRYLAVEAHRALAANDGFLPGWARELVDPAIARSTDSASASLAIALGRDQVPDPPPVFGVVRPRHVLGDSGRPDSAEAASAAAALAPGSRRTIDEEQEEDDDDDTRYLGDLLSSPVGGGGPVGRLLERLLSSTRRRAGNGPLGADAATHLARAWLPSGTRVVSTDRTTPSIEDAPGEASRLTYPEWDVHRKRYRVDWCTVVESDPRPEHRARMAMPDGADFRRSLARLGTGLERCRRRPQGDDVDIDAAVEAYIGARAGAPVDEAVYVESLRRRRDLSVQILLDASGSTNEPGPGGRPVHDHQRWVAAALAVALNDLGDRIALHAFNSQGRSAVRVIRIKAFGDRLDGDVVRRLGGLVPGAYTRLGAAIRHGTSMVDRQGGTSRRLLVVISDGFAYDHGYEGRYGEADARRALSEARRQGVGCLCLSVGAGLDAVALRRVFGSAAHASVATADELVATIGPLFRATLLAAESRRRVFQHQARTRERLARDRLDTKGGGA
jgi:hypothetical protein